MLAVGMIPLFIYFAFSLYKFRSATRDANYSKLDVLSTTKKDQLGHDFEFMKKQIFVLAQDEIVQSHKELSKSFQSFESQYTNEKFQALRKYYTDQFNVEYGKKNNGESYDIDNHLNQISKAGIVAQFHYIADNPNPLGEKLKYNNAQDGSAWSAAHARFHSLLKSRVEQFGYYDSFIVDGKTGNIIYSTFKETDFATSLTQGPLKNTVIAKIFNQIIKFINSIIRKNNF